MTTETPSTPSIAAPQWDWREGWPEGDEGWIIDPNVRASTAEEAAEIAARIWSESIWAPIGVTAVFVEIRNRETGEVCRFYVGIESIKHFTASRRD